MRPARLFCILLALSCLFTLMPAAGGSEFKYDDGELEVEDNFHWWLASARKGDELEFNVVSTKPTDVFVVLDSQFSGVSGDGYPTRFISEARSLNRTSHKFRWTVPDLSSYSVIVDNEFNNITGSADPTGALEFSIDVRNLTKEKEIMPMIQGILLVGTIMTAIVVIVIIAAVVFYLYKFFGHRKGGPGTYRPPHPDERAGTMPVSGEKGQGAEALEEAEHRK